MHRFFHPDSLDESAVELIGDEAHHLSRVLRLPPGSEVQLFDGNGHSALAAVTSIQKRSVKLDVLQRTELECRRTARIHVLTAAPKLDRLKWLIEKATELDVARVTLLRTHHSVVHPNAGKVAKLSSTVIASCKQCGRNDLMVIDAPRPLAEISAELASRKVSILVAAPGGDETGRSLSNQSPGQEVAVLVGPEGGWESSELSQLMSMGALAVGLGPHILRVETACLAAVSSVQHVLRNIP